MKRSSEARRKIHDFIERRADWELLNVFDAEDRARAALPSPRSNDRGMVLGEPYIAQGIRRSLRSRASFQGLKAHLPCRFSECVVEGVLLMDHRIGDTVHGNIRHQHAV